MDKAKVLEAYKLDDQAYQGTCTAIGLKNPDTLTGEQLDHFDTVRDWLDTKEVKNFKEATDRFKAQAAARLQDNKDSFGIVDILGDRIDQKARQGVEEVMGAISVSGEGVIESAMARYRKTFIEYATSPEIESKYFTPAIEGGQLPENFSQTLPQKGETPALQPSAG
jgi:hypothetical protein